MSHTDAELEPAAVRFGEQADQLDPVEATVEHTDDLRAVAATADAVAAHTARWHEGVALARARGRSWNEIALALGVSRRAARQRFAGRAA